ncbi:MAG: O-antigen ligase family protein [Elusimicrobiota bacterium]
MPKIKFSLHSFILLFIVTLPFIAFGINVGSETITLSFVAFLGIAIFYIAAKKSVPIPNDNLTKNLMLFFVIAAFSSYLTVNTISTSLNVLGDTAAMKDIKQLAMLFFIIIHFSLLLLVFKRQNLEQLRRYFWFFIYLSFFVSLYSIYQFAALTYDLPFGDILRNTKSYSVALKNETSGWMGSGMMRARAFMPESSFWGAYLLVPISFLLPFVFSSKSVKIFSMFTVFIIAMFLSFSRSGWAGLIIIFMIFTYIEIIYDNKLYKALNAVMVFSILFIFLTNFILPNMIEYLSSFSDHSAMVRFDIQRNSFLTFLKHPFMGIGWGNTGFFLMDFTTYNFYLQLLLETGLIGFVVFCAFLLKIWKVLTVNESLMSKSDGRTELGKILLGLKLAFISILFTWFNTTAYNLSYIWFVAALCCVFPLKYGQMLKEKT